MTSTEKIALRPHQVEAVDAVVRGLDIPPGKRIPRNGLRATVVAACGTGKTFIAAHSALRLARNDRVLVLLPTLDLLTQTVREWRSAGHAGPAVAVCSLDDDPHLWDLVSGRAGFQRDGLADHAQAAGGVVAAQEQDLGDCGRRQPRYRRVPRC